ncbi:hypothetical protein [Paraliomyxa miuraensis]|uniref:hypothetical protein n=1 Tax=Paraliomyxa miuraensis TaxID=376150 RepID=UPI002252EEE0|nr:hypothetical protein [Paraliomyxa miuraensis]
MFLNVAFTWGALGWTSGILLAYLLVAYFIRPRPDFDNIGWLGGLIDNPFRYSDDINRFLMFLMVVLLPGRFVSDSLVELAQDPRPVED